MLRLGLDLWQSIYSSGEAEPSPYESAVAVYALTALIGSNPTVVRLRRSSDNAESDFLASEIESGAALSWVGTGATDNGCIVTWYDQTPSNNHATQTSAAAQPKLIESGQLVTIDGSSYVRFDGIDDGLEYHYDISYKCIW